MRALIENGFEVMVVTDQLLEAVPVADPGRRHYRSL